MTAQTFTFLLRGLLEQRAGSSSRSNLATKLARSPEGGGRSAAPQRKRIVQFMERAKRDAELATALKRNGVLLAPYAMEREDYPFIPRLLPIEVNPLDTTFVSKLEGVAEIIVAWHLLQRVEDYRSFIASCFSKLAIGGKLLIVVPNLYTFERRPQLPSHVNPAHIRFYSLATLLQEVEEAIDPLEARVDLAAQIEGDDVDQSNVHDLALLLEKVTPPPWKGRFAEFDRPVATINRPTNVLPLKSADGPCHVISPDRGAMAKILVLKLDHRGDFLMGMESFRVLRESFPQAEITIACGSWNKTEAERSGIFSKVVAFNFFAEDVSTAPQVATEQQLLAEFEQLFKGESFDLVVDLRLTGDTRRLMQKVDARHKAGFDDLGAFPWLDISLSVPSATRQGRTMQEFWGAMKFSARDHFHNAFDITVDDAYASNRSHLVWGPYIDLPAGRYEVILHFNAAKGKGALEYDISYNNGETIAHRGVLDPTKDTSSIFIESETQMMSVEFRILPSQKRGESAFSFQGIKFVRQSSYSGVHQREAMALLAHLIALRTKDAFIETVEQ